MKQFASLILALCLCLAVAAPAAAAAPEAAAPLSMTWQNIGSISHDAAVIDGYLCVDAELTSHDPCDLKITAEISAPGLSTKTYSASTTGTDLDFYKEIVAVNGKTYTIELTFDADGETVTRTLTVYN